MISGAFRPGSRPEISPHSILQSSLGLLLPRAGGSQAAIVQSPDGGRCSSMSENKTIPDTVSAPAASFPPGLQNAFFFSAFNALSYQLVLSSPMVLYAKKLGASATVLGVIAGMMPLLVIFQIPAASYIPRLGFKRFVYAGWGTRVMFIFGMAWVPLTVGFLDAKNRLALMLMLLFWFNLSRGKYSCPWLPLITELVPATPPVTC